MAARGRRPPDAPGLDARLAFGPGDAEVLERETAWAGFFRLDVLRVRHRLFEGGWSEPVRRELFVRGPAVVLVPYDPRRDRVVMIEQFRIGALDVPGSPWHLEFVAGIAEPGEAPEDVARREAEEEAGLQPDPVEFLHRYQVSPGGNTEEILVYAGCVDSDRADGVHGLAEEHEDIRVHVLDLPVALAGLAAGEVRNAAAIIGLQWLALHREGLRARWLR
jgi:ADP-ribose pyrophosphatase